MKLANVGQRLRQNFGFVAGGYVANVGHDLLYIQFG
jgi:hypothetical protein